MSQGQLVIALLSLLVLGLGAIALMASIYARQAAEADDRAPAGPSELDQIALARRRREFMKRYPAWASRDFQNDRNSPWFTDPEFGELPKTYAQR